MKKLGRIPVGGGHPVRIMGIINLSPESFYKKSVRTARAGIRDRIQQMERCGADIIDMGAMSTAPYLDTLISEKTESERLLRAIKIAQDATNLPISADTCRAGVARDALELGVEIINDVTGLKYDKKMAGTIGRFEPSLVLCAHKRHPVSGDPAETKRILKESVLLAKNANLPPDKMVLDPAIGFFRSSGRGRFLSRIRSDWVCRDLAILHNLRRIKGNFPMLVSVSRKSFLGAILGRDEPGGRIAGSLACEMMSIINGADVIRTHDVLESKKIAAIAQRWGRTNKSL